jgi:hypothetical protein
VDRYLVPILRATAEPLGVDVVEADAMALDWEHLLGTAIGSWTLVANLPYNLATPLVADLLDEVPAIRRMLVMVQREVGERLAAGAGTDPYGAVSVKVAYWATAKVVGRVPASVFIPRPAVESVLVDIRRRQQPAVGAARCCGGRSMVWSAWPSSSAPGSNRPPGRRNSMWPRGAGWPPAVAPSPAASAALLAGATLPTGRLQHLLVLLLPHALTALLDQRTHGRMAP